MTSQWEGSQEQAWGHAAAAPPPFSNYGYPPSSYQGEMPDPTFGTQYFDLPQLEQGMRIMGAYARRNMEDIDAIRRHTTQLEDGTAGIAYEMEEHFYSIMTKDTTQEPIKESDRWQDHE